MKKIILTALAVATLGVGMSACDTATEGTHADKVVSQQKANAKDAKSSDAPKETPGQQNARESAESYLNGSAFSRTSLIEQLEFEGFSTKDATYGVEAQKADWNKQAAASAESYLDTSAFSRVGLIDQLKFEGFTVKQATYGVTQAGL